MVDVTCKGGRVSRDIVVGAHVVLLVLELQAEVVKRNIVRR